MTTATATVSRETFEDRWWTITRQARRERDGFHADNSETYYRILNDVQGIGAMLVEESLDVDELEALDEAWTGIWKHARQTLVDWAVETEQRRAAVRRLNAPASS